VAEELDGLVAVFMEGKRCLFREELFSSIPFAGPSLPLSQSIGIIVSRRSDLTSCCMCITSTGNYRSVPTHPHEVFRAAKIGNSQPDDGMSTFSCDIHQ
jgi:hypothetical protein